MTSQVRTNQINSIAVVILAAGQSSRLGTPKQLLPYRDKTLLEHVIEQADLLNPDLIIVVLGANSSVIQQRITFKNLIVAENSLWPEGISSSIRMGVQTACDSNGDINGLLLMTCDQPFADGKILREIIRLQAINDLPLCASTYAETFGVPSLFHRSLFPDLLRLEGDAGAKKVIKQHQAQTVFVPFERGSIDIDTALDYEKLIND